VVEGVAEEAEVDCEASLVVEETELCSAEFVELDEKAVLVTLPEPLAVVEKLPVDGMPTFGSDQQ